MFQVFPSLVLFWQEGRQWRLFEGQLEDELAASEWVRTVLQEKGLS